MYDNQVKYNIYIQFPRDILMGLSKFKAFSLAEALITIMIIGMISAATLPMMTQISQNKTNVDRNVLTCVKNNTSSGWYNGSTGDTSLPSTGTECYAAVVDAQFDRGKAVDTAKWYADHANTTAEKNMAKTILRAACDQGGEKACDYFIEQCWKSGSGTAPYCDNTSNFLDLTYYLHQHNVTSTNIGAAYIADELGGIVVKMIPNIINEVTYACESNQTPDYNQNLLENYACIIASPELYIRACNAGNANACTKAYDENWNRSCSQVKGNWDDAPTGNYELTYNGPASPVTVYCNMISIATAAITGCNANPYVPLDCLFGQTQNYNQTCAEIFDNWATAPDGNYNLTASDYDPPDPGDTLCERAPVCESSDIGTDCLGNGTLYIGNWSGYDLFTTATDNSSGVTYGSNGDNDADSVADGLSNQTNMLAHGSAPAAQICSSLVVDTMTDWYLPSTGELDLLYRMDVQESGAFGLSNARYWSSTQSKWWLIVWFYNVAYSQHMGTGSVDSSSARSTNYRVRCIRRVSP